MTARIQIEKNLHIGVCAFLKIKDKTLALYHVARRFYATDDSYLHQEASIRGAKFEGCVHGLGRDLVSGYILNSTQLKVTS